MLNTSQILQRANFPESIKETAYKIANIEIQGATNVAIQTLNSTIIWLKSTDIHEIQELIDTTIFYLDFLANVRPNEPLAKNAVKYIKFYIQEHRKQKDFTSIKQVKDTFIKLADQYLKIISKSKKEIIKKGPKYLESAQIILTHCHSSTAEALIIAVNKQNKIKVITTETRPRYQGRITAKNLIAKKVDTIMIVDSAAPHFITDNSILPVDAILLGADELTVYGDTINKVGSFGITLSAHYAEKPVYVVTPSLKLHYKTLIQRPTIEQRPASEVWKDAPRELKIINPAFELIPRTFIKGFITEFGLLTIDTLEKTVVKAYPWIKSDS